MRRAEPEPPLREVDQQYLSVVHDLADVDRALGLAQRVADGIGLQQGADFVLHRHYSSLALVCRPARKFLGPESAHDRIVRMRKQALAIFVACQETGETE